MVGNYKYVEGRLHFCPVCESEKQVSLRSPKIRRFFEQASKEATEAGKRIQEFGLKPTQRFSLESCAGVILPLDSCLCR